MLALETAMRSKEIMDLQWKHIHLDEKYLTLMDTKNGDKRDVPLSQKATELLKLALNRHPEKVFTISSELRDTLFRKYRPFHLRHIVFHDTRHEAITRLARKVDVLDVARIIGHRDLKSLMIYYNASASEIAKRL